MEKLSREACASIVGGAKSCEPGDHLRAERLLRLLQVLHALAHDVAAAPPGRARRRAAGRASRRCGCRAGRARRSARIETGTSARSSSPSVRTPRRRSQRRSAPVTTASTTSLTVPPSAFLIALNSSSCRAHPDHAPVRADRDVERGLRAPGSGPPTPPRRRPPPPRARPDSVWLGVASGAGRCEPPARTGAVDDALHALGDQLAPATARGAASTRRPAPRCWRHRARGRTAPWRCRRRRRRPRARGGSC